MMTSERESLDRAVDEARQRAYLEIGGCPEAQIAPLQRANGQYPGMCLSCARSLAALIEAVSAKARAEERERIRDEARLNADGSFGWRMSERARSSEEAGNAHP